jgi:hypothetical protein
MHLLVVLELYAGMRAKSRVSPAAEAELMRFHTVISGPE